MSYSLWPYNSAQPWIIFNEIVNALDVFWLDSNFRLLNAADTSKKLAFDLSAITTATTRTITMSDHDVALADIANNRKLHLMGF